jgi:hypothetical protein
MFLKQLLRHIFGQSAVGIHVIVFNPLEITAPDNGLRRSGFAENTGAVDGIPAFL